MMMPVAAAPAPRGHLLASNEDQRSMMRPTRDLGRAGFASPRPRAAAPAGTRSRNAAIHFSD
jgi:hypothetical protein